MKAKSEMVKPNFKNVIFSENFDLIIVLNFSLRLGRCHFLFSCNTVWAVFFVGVGSAAVLLDGKFTFHPRNPMELP